MVRHDWTLEEIKAVHNQPLMDLIYQAQGVHREHFSAQEVQLCSLLSIKTGACPEDCHYCPQSARHHADLDYEALMDVDVVLASAREARNAGATRFCMGAAWREVKDNAQFDRVLDMVRGVKDLGMEACCTLGMLTSDQAKKLADAGLTAYNHNLDTSPEFYENVITTRTYADRLNTLKNVRSAGIEVCCGGILGMGEGIDDRCSMLQVLSSLTPHPESVPINALVPVDGTPLEGRPTVSTIEMVRMIATTRILMPKTMVRLSAGRLSMSQEGQILCMMAGANSIFFGGKLLTTANPSYDEDMAVFAAAGVQPMKPRANL